MAQANKKSGTTELNRCLTDMNRDGGFVVSVLTDVQGLAIAFATKEGIDPDRQSAVVAFVQKAATQVSKQLGMAKADEISMYDADGQHLVCRPFQINTHELILAIMVPDRHKSYRRLTNRAIIEIGRVWAQYWE